MNKKQLFGWEVYEDVRGIRTVQETPSIKTSRTFKIVVDDDDPS